MLDLSSLNKAIAQLEDALSYAESDLARNDSKLALHLRAAAIQAFEFTYELSFKMLKRYLEATEVNPSAVEEMTFNEFVRRGFEIGVLQAEIAEWKEFRKDRGTTSHAYNEAKAKDVFREAARLKIIPDAEKWIGHYDARNETSHTYNSETAKTVFERAEMFLPDAKKLLEALRNAN